MAERYYSPDTIGVKVDPFNLDVDVSILLAKVIRVFAKKYGDNVPAGEGVHAMCCEGPAVAEWQAKLEKMARAFDISARSANDDELTDAEKAERDEGLLLFAIHLKDLWV